MIKLLILLTTSILFSTVTDIDGNVYETVQIGDQLWMAENLKVTHYNNGDVINTITSNDSVIISEEGVFVPIYYNSEFINDYGLLYNWYAVYDDRGICPEYFHIPDDDDWNKHYPFNVENVEQFAKFCLDCGGFEIC